MVWLHSINKAVEYIEENICEDITAGEVAAYVHSSYSNFVRIFYLVTGVTLTEYIRNCRLSLAGRDLLTTDAKVIDIALKYQYDTPESFSKAFSRFHGMPIPWAFILNLWWKTCLKNWRSSAGAIMA